jgi:hypothetical protein
MAKNTNRYLNERRLVPRALREVLSGRMPAELTKALGLPRSTSFEDAPPSWVVTRGRREEARLLGMLGNMTGEAVASRRVDLSAPAFPAPVPAKLTLDMLPLHTRTRNRLRLQGWTSARALRKLSLGDLLALPDFDATCLVDLLSAVEADDSGGTVRLRGAPDRLREILTAEARQLGALPWAGTAGVFDLRLAPVLFRDPQALKEIEQALDQGRFHVDRPFFATNRIWALALTPAMVRRTNSRDALLRAGLTDLRTIASRTLGELIAFPHLGRSSLIELLGVLDVCRFLEPLRGEGDRPPTLADLCDGILRRTEDNWFPEGLAERLGRLRLEGERLAGLPLEAELREIVESVLPGRSPEVAEYLAWDGHGSRTLNKVAGPRHLTRERVRQVVAFVTDRLSVASVWCPALDKALELCTRVCPRSAAEVAERLWIMRISRGVFQVHGLITAADILGRRPRLVLKWSRDRVWLFLKEDD